MAKVNTNLGRISNGFKLNKLTLNVKKSNCIIFTSKDDCKSTCCQLHMSHPQVSLTDGNSKLEESYSVCLLLSPHAGIDYNFNLDDNEGVCDLFDVQILNY